MMSTLSSTVYAGIGGGTTTHNTSKPTTTPHTTPYTHYTGTVPTSGNTSVGTTVSQRTGPTGGGDPDDPDSPGEDDPSSGGGPGPGGGGDVHVTNITNNYYYLDVGLQFKPRVGVLTSINNSSDLIPMGSNRDSDDDICINPGTVWSPSSDEIPDVAATIGRQYSYGVLYSGYWDTPLEGGARDMEIIIPKKSTSESSTDESTSESSTGESTSLTSDYDSINASVERSWANRDPGAVLSDDVGPESGGKEDFYTEYEKAIYRPVPEEPDWDYPDNWDSVKSQEYCKSKGLVYTLGRDAGDIGRRYMITPYVFNSWYRESDAVKDTQHNDNPSQFMYPVNYESKLSDDALRAVNILGEDILLRDEWVGSTVFQMYTGSPNYYGYTYSNTNVLDTREVLGDNLLTADYVIQSIYRALGVNNLRGQVYFYADKDLTVDFTPLAEKITVAMDKINQVQNRVDVFVTRTDLEGYWNKAIEDGVVTNYGIGVLNDIDAAYKPFAKKLDSDKAKDFAGMKYIDGAWIDEATGLKYADGTWIEKASEEDTIKVPRLDKNGKEMADTNGDVIYDDAPNYKRIDYNRTKTMTLAEFCVYVKKLMDIYGEEAITDKEMEMLLVYYGTKLPYGLESEEQLEAIKYLMAKGIVSDSMYWEGALTLEDMLVILSRVKDKGSRLTFKEIELEYDPNLVSMGYCPAEMTFVDETSIGVVSTTLNESYSYNNAEWFDYFLRMPLTVESKDGKKEINPRFLRTDGAQEYVTTDLFVTQKGIKDSNNNNNEKEDLSEDEAYTYLRNSTSQEGKDGIEVVGYESLDDGYEYLHIRVKTSLILKDNSLNDEYVNPKNNCIYINTNDRTDAPLCWKIDYRGGIFRNPVLSGNIVKWESANYYTKGTKYNINKDEQGLPVCQDLSSYKLKLDDFDALAEHKTCKSLVVSLNIDGTVKDAYTYAVKKGTDSTLKYMSFDQAGWEYKYCDYDRYTNGLAISFARNPMLDDDTSFAEDLSSMIPQYDIWFYVKSDEGDTSDALASDIYLGDVKIVDKSSPAEILDTTGSIEFLGKSEGKYYYVARGQHNEEWLSNNLHAEGDSLLDASYFTGYIKQNNTILIKDTDLFNIIESTNSMYKNGTVTRINDDVICVSFDLIHSTVTDAITHTIYLCESLKLIAVNNMLYEVPSDEVLFVDNTPSGGSYLLNYRAVVGWGSGYTYNALANGDVEVKLSTVGEMQGECKMASDISGIRNAYTGRSVPTTIIERRNSKFSIPASAPNNFASWFIYKSNRIGTYAVILKNNDIGAGESNSVIKEIMNDQTISQRYKEGADWLDDLFGVSVSSSDTWYNSDILVSVYKLTGNDSNPYVISYDDAMAAKNNPEEKIGERTLDKVGNKFYYDSSLCTWAYIPLGLHTEDSYLSFSYSFDRFNTLINQGNKTAEYIQKSDSKVEAFVKGYYKGEYILPYASLSGGSTFIDVSCNVHSGKKYGSIPVWTICCDSTDIESTIKYTKNDKKIFGILPESAVGDLWYPEYKKENGTITMDKDTSLTSWSAITSLVPPNPIQLILGVDKTELSKDRFSSDVFVHWGNYPVIYHPSDGTITLSSCMKVSGYAEKPKEKIVYMVGLSITKQIASLLGSATIYDYTKNRDVIIDKTTKASLQDLNQIGGVNWGAYTFDNLVHDVDNGLSILLIIVLNIIPRIGMFIFVILIGLSTVANMKPVQRFCDNIFDPYKLITLGHCTVYTINTKLLLISSIIGLAAFGLFMDGTLINLLTWLVQFVSAFVTR